MPKANLIFFDLETSPIETRTWSLWPKSISHDSIMQDWTIICAAWKRLGQKTVHSVQVDKPYKDKELVKQLRDELAEADCLIGHNLDKFDIRKLNTRLIFHGLKPMPLIPTVDTLKLVRKIAAFSSNRLDYLSKMLTGEGKIHVDYQLWLKVMAGDKAALKLMVDYCKVDVLKLEELYLKLLPYSKQHPHVGAMEGKDRHESCPGCGSERTHRNGIRVTASGLKRQEQQCQDCGKYFTTSIV